MIRVRFLAPASCGLLVTGAAAVALANALFAREPQSGTSTLRLARSAKIGFAAELRWLGIAWDAIGEPEAIMRPRASS